MRAIAGLNPLFGIGKVNKDMALSSESLSSPVVRVVYEPSTNVEKNEANQQALRDTSIA